MNKNKNKEKLIGDIKKIYRDNMTNEQKQKRREATKRYRDNMSDEQKQKLRDCQIDYQKKYHAAKKNINNKITNDNNNDFYYVSITIKLKDIVPIIDIVLTSLFRRM